MFYTYLLRSLKDHRWYTGCTDDLRKRFKQHNRGEVLSTKGRGPFDLIYYEACRNNDDAFARERFLKSGPGKRYLKKRLKRFLFLTGLAGLLWSALLLATPPATNAGVILQAPTYVGLNSGLVGYWSFNGPDVAGVTAYDRSGQGNNSTLTNGPARTAGKIGQALSFDGTDKYVDTIINELISPSTGTFSVWLRPTGPSDSHTSSFHLPRILGEGGGNMGIHRGDVSGTDRIWIFNWDGNEDKVGASYNPEEWTHIVWVHSNGVLFGYKNGQLFGSTSSGNTSAMGPIRIGSSYQGVGGFFTGQIDEVRAYNRALTPDEIKRLYKIGSTFTINATRKDTLTSGLVGHWTFDQPDIATNNSGIVTAYDRPGSSNNASSTSGGAVTSPTRVIGRIGQALSFDGSNDRLDVFAPGLNNIAQVSVSAWIYPQTFSTIKNIFGITPTSPGWALRLFNANNLDFSVAGTAAMAARSPADSITPNQWQHVTVVWNGSNTASDVKFYVNGILVTTSGVQNLSGRFNDAGLSWKIGSLVGSQDFLGFIDDVRIYNRALTADEIKRLYNMGGTFKINATRKDVLTSGLVGHWSFDQPDMAGVIAYDRSGQENNGTLTNGPTKAIGKLGQALEFDGVDDAYVDIASDVALTGAKTVSFWAKWNSTPDAYILGGVSTQYYPYVNSTNIYIRNEGGLSNVAHGGITIGQWYHIAISGNGTIATVFKNGVSLGTMTDRGPTVSAIASATDFFGSTHDGILDDVRLYNRALSPDEIKRLYNMGR